MHVNKIDIYCIPEPFILNVSVLNKICHLPEKKYCEISMDVFVNIFIVVLFPDIK